MIDQQRRCLSTAAIIAFCCVLFGAFGAHALKDILSETGKRQYDLGIHYAFLHAFAIMVLALARPQATNLKHLDLAFRLFVAGIVLFSGSLILLGLSGVTTLVFLTPLGGLSLLGAWIFFFLSFKKA